MERAQGYAWIRLCLVSGLPRELLSPGLAVILARIGTKFVLH